MQAVVSATTQGDEFIKEFFINHDKVTYGEVVAEIT